MKIIMDRQVYGKVYYKMIKLKIEVLYIESKFDF